MTDQEIQNIVAFCILMQNGEGILSKSPDYIEEKYKVCIKGGKPLDSSNQQKFDQYIKTWMGGQ